MARLMLQQANYEEDKTGDQEGFDELMGLGTGAYFKIFNVLAPSTLF